MIAHDCCSNISLIRISKSSCVSMLISLFEMAVVRLRPFAVSEIRLSPDLSKSRTEPPQFDLCCFDALLRTYLSANRSHRYLCINNVIARCGAYVRQHLQIPSEDHRASVLCGSYIVTIIFFLYPLRVIVLRQCEVGRSIFCAGYPEYPSQLVADTTLNGLMLT